MHLKWREALRRSPIYTPWRLFRERQQLAAFHNLLDHYLRNSDYSGPPYSIEHSQTLLQAKQPQRRPFTNQDGLPHVVAFGAEDWERYGLWPTFRRCGNFHLFNYGQAQSRMGGKPSPALQYALHQEFLEYVDSANREIPVTACFFYADSAYIAPQLIRDLGKRGIWTILMGLDDKHRFYERKAYGLRVGQVTLAQDVDLMWTTWRTGAELILTAGGIPWYAPPGADPAFHHPIDCPRDLDVVFIGQSYGTRASIVHYLRKHGFQVEAFGQGWPNGFLEFEEIIRLYSRAKVVLGVGGVQSMEGVKHLKGRDFEVPMCGALYLTTYNPELADHYVLGRDLLCYGSVEECSDILRWLLLHPEKQQDIRQAGLICSVQHHTWERRLTQLFRLFPKSKDI